MPRSDSHASPDGRLAENYLTGAFPVAVVTTGVVPGRRSERLRRAAPISLTGGSHENA